MNKKNNIWKEAAPYLCAFFIPVFVMIGVFIQRGIFPFGEMSFLRTDLYHQYAPFFQEMKGKLSDGGSLLYSWNIGMGTNFAALFAYYLASPVNWLLFLCPQRYVIEFITYFIVIKIGLSSLSMTYYLVKHNEKKSIGMAFFGIFYGLSGYMAAYSWNIMWLDCILLFPLIILGLERLVKKDQCFLYCITLALAILSNYYIAIMICIFLVIYFFVTLFLLPCNGFQYVKKMLQFAIYSLLAGGLAAIVLLPEIYALHMTASSSINFPQTVTSYFSIFDMMARHLVDVETHIGLEHWPNIYCGVAILFLLPLYILNRKINHYEKFIYCGLVLFFYLSFSNNILNFIWHGLHFPNSLPARQSFIYVFLILTMAYKGFEGIKARSVKQLVGCMWLAIGFIILAEKLVTETFFHWDTYYVSILFIAVYGALAYLYRKEHLTKSVTAVFVLILVFIESFVNTTVTSVTTTNRTSYVKDDRATREMMEAIEQQEDSFYRVEKTKIRTKNDGAWLNYPSISIFSSTANANLTEFFKIMGLESSTNAYGSVGSTFLSNMIFGVKYNISGTELEDSSCRELYMNNDGVYIYKNSYALPLGFMTASDLNTTWMTESANPLDNLNSFAESAAEVSDLYMPLDTNIIDTNSSSITVAESGYTYLYVNKAGPNKVQVTDGAGNTSTYDNLNRGYILDMGYREAGELLTVSTVIEEGEQSKALTVFGYQMDENKLRQVYQALNQSPMIVDSYDDTHISSHVTARKDGLLITTIPYEKGWTVTVDGNKVTPEIFKDAFISIPLKAGSHTLSFSYTAGGLKEGALITAASGLILLLLFLFTLFWKRRKKNLSEKDPKGELLDNLGEYFIPDSIEEEAVNTHHVEEILKEKKRETDKLPPVNSPEGQTMAIPPRSNDETIISPPISSEKEADALQQEKEQPTEQEQSSQTKDQTLVQPVFPDKQAPKSNS